MVAKAVTWTWLHSPPRYHKFHQKSTPLIQSFLKDLLQAGAIERTSFIAFQERLFSIPKKDTIKWREILGISTEQVSFLSQICRHLLQNAWGVSIDLKDAYSHVPIHKSSIKYLAFAIDNH